MNLTKFVKESVAAKVEALVERILPAAVQAAAVRVANDLVDTVPVTEIARRLGYKDPLSAMRRLGIPVVKITERKHVVRMSDYTSWLDGRTEQAVRVNCVKGEAPHAALERRGA
jgi:hypothetical protein